jgi:hypothetical protein
MYLILRKIQRDTITNQQSYYKDTGSVIIYQYIVNIYIYQPYTTVK